MRLLKRSINNFREFLKVFLARYANFQTPRKSCDSLFKIIQGHKEKTRVYVNRFIKASRKVHNYNEELALAAIKKGLRDRGPDTPVRDVNGTLLAVYPTRIVPNKTGMSKVLISLGHRVWVWVRKKFVNLSGMDMGKGFSLPVIHSVNYI
jgi:Retrotransposon gag protein